MKYAIAAFEDAQVSLYLSWKVKGIGSGWSAQEAQALLFNTVEEAQEMLE